MAGLQFRWPPAIKGLFEYAAVFSFNVQQVCGCEGIDVFRKIELDVCLIPFCLILSCSFDFN